MRNMSTKVHILSLPQDVLALILQYATDTRNGQVPFKHWNLMSVCTKFQSVLRSMVYCVDLETAYQFAEVKRLPLLLEHTLPKCRVLKHLDIRGCHSLNDLQVGKFLRRCPPLRSCKAVICSLQTDLIVDDLTMRAASVLHSLELEGCSRRRHGLVSGYKNGPFHPCRSLSDTSVLFVAERCPNLRHITLSKAFSVTNYAFKALGTLSHLESVELSRLNGITTEAISYLADGHGHLESLKVHSCRTFSNSSLVAVAHGRATRHLRKLSLDFLHTVTEVGVREVVGNLPKLEDLQFNHCSQLKESWCADWTGNVSPLKRLSFPGDTMHITAKSLYNFTRIAKLELLNLSYVNSVNASILTTLHELAPNISSLLLRGCESIDDSAASVLATFSNLSTLDIVWCPSLTTKGISAIVKGSAGKKLETFALGPVNGDDKNEMAANIARECTNLRKISFCGERENEICHWLVDIYCVQSEVHCDGTLYTGSR